MEEIITTDDSLLRSIFYRSFLHGLLAGLSDPLRVSHAFRSREQLQFPMLMRSEMQAERRHQGFVNGDLGRSEALI